MDPLAIFILGVHVLGATIWVGGSIALGIVTMALAETDPARQPESDERIGRVGRRLSWVMWPALLITILSGGYNLSWFLTPGVPLWNTPAGPWLVAKFIAVGVIVVTAGLHTFVLGPQLRRARERGVEESLLARPRRVLIFLGIVSTLASVLVIFLAVAAAEV
jgi:putative copper export protein